jgi:hypothetical protein
MNCPYGGECIDPGNPSDCEANSGCVNFKSKEEKVKFDSLPDQYYFKYGNGVTLKFKNQTQLDFLLTDLPASIKEEGGWGKLSKSEQT